MKMKEINFDGKDFLYDMKEYSCGDYGCFICYETTFYKYEPKIKKRREYYLFGKKIEIKSHEVLFKLGFNIESPKYSKKEIREFLRKKLGILERVEEIQRGEII